MSFLNRIQEILAANVNDLLDKVENPEASINQMIRNMEKGISDMRKHTAAIMASRKTNARRFQKAVEEENHWLKHAEMAIAENRDDLAQKALLQKKLAGENKVIIAGQLETEASLIAKMKSELIMLEDKIQEVRSKRDTLIAKKQAEKTRQRFTDANRKWSDTASKIINGFHQFDQSGDETAVPDAHGEKEQEDLQAEFQKRKVPQNLEEELLKLKEKIKKNL